MARRMKILEHAVSTSPKPKPLDRHVNMIHPARHDKFQGMPGHKVPHGHACLAFSQHAPMDLGLGKLRMKERTLRKAYVLLGCSAMTVSVNSSTAPCGVIQYAPSSMGSIRWLSSAWTTTWSLDHPGTVTSIRLGTSIQKALFSRDLEILSLNPWRA